MSALEEVLLKKIVDNARTRRYQEGLDRMIDGLRDEWDADRGLLKARAADPLPHEKDPGWWRIPLAERAPLTPPQAAQVYAANEGRDATGPLGVAAFCWYSPLSRHHREPALLKFFANGLKFQTDCILEDGTWAMYGLNGEGWAQGWDVEGLIYGAIFCRDALDPALLDEARARLRRAARKFSNIDRRTSSIGSYGNQRSVFALGLNLYGQFLDMPDLLEMSERYWEDICPIVLDNTGQVVEQHGPCMHYSHTAFIYAWLNLAVRGDRSQLERVWNCLDWFRCKHTASLYPVAGPSARMYYERPGGMLSDLWPAAEQVAHLDGSVREFVDRGMERVASFPDVRDPLRPRSDMFALTSHHACSPMMWAMLMTQADESLPGVPPRWPRKVSNYYHSTRLLNRAPLKYMLIHRDYQTHFNFSDYLPFGGLQTWALGDEPPILHPTPLYPSTTRAMGLDTARQSASHNWACWGAGALVPDGFPHLLEDKDPVAVALARYDWMWRAVFFTPRSTVIVEFGKGGPRTTYWTLNRLEPAEPVIGQDMVRFEGRRACIHSNLGAPRLETAQAKDPWADGVRQIVYETAGEGYAIFALSDESFRCEPITMSKVVDYTLTLGATPPPRRGQIIRFSDASGRYEAELDPRFDDYNPGNLRIDPWQLAHGTVVRKRG